MQAAFCVFAATSVRLNLENSNFHSPTESTYNGTSRRRAEFICIFISLPGDNCAPAKVPEVKGIVA